MTAFLVAQMEIEDLDEFQKYLHGFMPILEAHGGEVLAIDAQTEILVGDWAYSRTAILKFPSPEHAHRWYDSPQYQELVQHFRRSSKANLVLLRGLK